jgi:thermostable 8-oxoguanine DNA glycosylase
MPQFTFLKDGKEYSIRLPEPDVELLPGVAWGEPCALFTPAYWYTQYVMQSGLTQEKAFRLGTTLVEEVTACLLGGHGIPAEVGLAAFYRLRDDGLIASLCTDQLLLETRLREPLSLDNRKVTYRFWRQKAVYLTAAYRAFADGVSYENDVDLRSKLTTLPGIGPKTASWIVRNWLDSDNVAILDIHIVRAGLLAQLFSRDEDVRRNYVTMEVKFIAFSRALGVRTSELDALMWRQMRLTPRVVSRLLETFVPTRQSDAIPPMPSL